MSGRIRQKRTKHMDSPHLVMKVLALTGGIASGKSTVAKMFQDLGALILNADTLAHETYAPGTPLYRELLQRYGNELAPSGAEINRKALAKILFQNPKEKQWLEAKIHPLTRAKIKTHLENLAKKKASPPLVLVEAALHVEGNYYQEFDGLIVVDISPEVQLERLQARDHLSLQEAQARLANQLPLEEKKKYANWVIENSGTLQETAKEVKKLYSSLVSSPSPKT